MAEEYGFKRKDCYCGLDLKGKKVEVVGLWRDTQPMGKCPNCGRDMLLDAPPVEPVIVAPAAIKKSTSKK